MEDSPDDDKFMTTTLPQFLNNVDFTSYFSLPHPQNQQMNAERLQQARSSHQEKVALSTQAIREFHTLEDKLRELTASIDVDKRNHEVKLPIRL